KASGDLAKIILTRGARSVEVALRFANGKLAAIGQPKSTINFRSPKLITKTALVFLAGVVSSHASAFSAALSFPGSVLGSVVLALILFRQSLFSIFGSVRSLSKNLFMRLRTIVIPAQAIRWL